MSVKLGRWEIYRGDTEAETVTIIVNRSIVDLTDKTVELNYKSNDDTRSGTITGVIDKPTSGKVTFSFNDTDVDTVFDGTYNIKVITDSKPKTYIKNVFKVVSDL